MTTSRPFTASDAMSGYGVDTSIYGSADNSKPVPASWLPLEVAFTFVPGMEGKLNTDCLWVWDHMDERSAHYSYRDPAWMGMMAQLYPNFVGYHYDRGDHTLNCFFAPLA